MESNNKSIELDESLIVNKQYFEQLKEQLICSICLGLLDDPLICVSCETPFCSNCIKSWFQKNNSCPMRCLNVELKEIQRFMKKILDGLKLKCKYGCEVSLLSYRNHLISCENERKILPCWNCGCEVKYTQMKVRSEDEYQKLIEENEKLKKLCKEQDLININRLTLNEKDSFDPDRLDLSQLTLKDDNMTVIKSFTSTHATSFGKKEYISGRSELNIKINNPGDTPWICIGLIESSIRHKYDNQSIPNVICLRGFDYDATNMQPLRCPKFNQGDILSFIIDFDKDSFVIKGITNSFEMKNSCSIKGKTWRVFIELYYLNSSISILCK